MDREQLATHFPHTEKNTQIGEVIQVLSSLEEHGIIEPAVGGGWIRGILTNTPIADIDISYRGPIPSKQGQTILLQVLQRNDINPIPYDIPGIWNIQEQYPFITRIAQNYFYLFVTSIDSLHMTGDGVLHDPTHRGIVDMQQQILRLTDYEQNKFPYTSAQHVYICVEGLRRAGQYHWVPTERSIELIHKGISQWELLSPSSKEYFYRKVLRKNYFQYKDIYDFYGWNFLLEETANFNSYREESNV